MDYGDGSGVQSLQSKIDKVNSLSKEELAVYYREVLSSNELSEKGGAGLGIIDLARKSGNKIAYEFNAVDGNFTFFTLIVTID